MEENKFELEWTQYSAKDYKKLNNSQAELVDKALIRIKQQGMQAGQPLHGKVAGCNKLKHQRAGLRIVFQQTDKAIEIIQIVAIGKRSDGKVYLDAEFRLK